MRNDFSGIYIFKNLINGKVYIGSSIRVLFRKGQHQSDLSENKHYNEHFQNAWNKYGGENFSWEILEKCIFESIDHRKNREQYWIDLYRSSDENYDYNITHPVKSVTPSPRRSAISKKMWKDPEFQTYISEVRKDTANDPMFAAKISTSQKLNWEDPIFQEKMKQRDERLKKNEEFKELKRQQALEQSEDPAWIEFLSKKAKDQWAKNRDSLISAQRTGWARKKAEKLNSQ